MNLADLKKKTGYTEAVKGDDGAEIKDAYTGDLLSDVMANAPSDSALITIQGHKNTVAVASLAGIKVIILCNGRQAPADMAESAENEGIAVLLTKENQFRVSSRLYELLS